MGSSESKIPVRSIVKLLTNLPPAVREKLERAFAEAEEQLDYHNVSAVDQINPRKVTTKIKSPFITVTTNESGFDVNWDKVVDRRITHYEIQISSTENFRAPVTYNIVDNFFAVEGSAKTTYVRARAVRWNGQASKWSNPLTVRIETHIVGPAVYSRDITNIPSFYIEFPNNQWPNAIQHLTISPQKVNGGVLVFGSVGVEFYVDATGFRGTYENLFYLANQVSKEDTWHSSMNGEAISNAVNIPCFTNPGWANIMSPPQHTVFGYSVGFGPAYLPHSQFYFWTHQRFVPQGNTQTADQSGLGTVVGWFDKKNIQKQIPDEGVYGTTTYAGYRMSQPAPVPGTKTTTKTLAGKNFAFKLDAREIVLGIKVETTATVTQELNFGTSWYDRVRLVDAGTPRPTTKGNGIVGFGTTTFGSSTDLWGEVAGYWTPAKINNAEFGVDFRGTFTWPPGATQILFQLWSPRITVYTNRGGIETAHIQLVYKPRVEPSRFYFPYTRSVLKNCTINAVEFGTGNFYGN